MYEVEIKFVVKNDDIFAKFKNDGYAISKLVQNDYIFVDGCIEDFANMPANTNVLRVRESNDKTTTTLKQVGNLLEIETEVYNGENMREIYEILGYKNIVNVLKTRYEWQVNGTTITYDEVENLGTFVEIEKLIDDEKDIEKVRSEILNFALTLGLQESDISKDSKYDIMVWKNQKLDFNH